MQYKLPNFLIIGAEKAGTTSLYHYLRQNPAIFMPSVKEPHFFSHFEEDYEFIGPGNAATPPITRLDEYRALFEQCDIGKLKGEASPSYLHIKGTAANMKRIVGENVKLIVSLRNPVDRAYSNFIHNVRKGREKISFEAALDKEEERKQCNWDLSWHYKTKGFYFEQLEEYFLIFDPQKIKVIIFDDFRKNPGKILDEINQFLGLQPFQYNTETRHSTSGIYKIKQLNHFNKLETQLSRFLPDRIKFLLKKMMIKKPSISKDLRKKLALGYEEDIKKLQNLIKRDLSDWMPLNN